MGCLWTISCFFKFIWWNILKIWCSFCYIFTFSHLLYPILCINGKLSPKKDVENLWGKVVGFVQKKDGRSHLVKREQPSVGLILWHGT